MLSMHLKCSSVIARPAAALPVCELACRRGIDTPVAQRCNATALNNLMAMGFVEIVLQTRRSLN
jgi:hypothetical protein